MDKQENLARIHSRIREACKTAGREEREVSLIAVGKTKPWEELAELAQFGVKDFGENYVQEALGKIASLSQANPPLGEQLHWHFIGSLQSNKAKFIPGKFTLLHSLDTEQLAQKLNHAAAKMGLVQDCLVEVNLDNEPTKGGLAPDYLPHFLGKLADFSALRVKGLMGIPAPQAGENKRKPFADLRMLLEKMNKSAAYKAPLSLLSMGMSADFEEAILEGATHIRVGTALFGERQKK